MGILGKPHWRLRQDFRVLARGPLMVMDVRNNTTMLLQFFFRQLPLQQQVSFLQSKGVSLGSRIKDGRRIYVYMIRNLFVEVLFEKDNPSEAAEQVHILRGLKNLNAYLEQEFRSTF